MDELVIANDVLVIEHDCTTNSITEREMNAAEIAAKEAREAAELAKAEAEATKAAARQALLDKLGITAEEAALLLG